MYTITIDGAPFLDPRVPEYTLEAPILEREANKFGTLTFTIYPDHPQYDNINLFSSLLRVYRDGEIMIVMRPIERKRTMFGGIEYECEELMGVLHDTIYRPDAYGIMNDMISRWLTMISNHKSARPGLNYPFTSESSAHCTTAFDADIAEENEPFAVNNYKPHWDVIKSETFDKWGGYVYTVYDENEMHIRYHVEDELPAGAQQITFGENLKDLFITSGGDGFFTRVIPLGEDRETSEAYRDRGGSNNVPLTIIGQEVRTGRTSYSTSVDYIPDWEYEEATGIVIEHVERWEKELKNKTTAQKKATIYKKGLNYLNENKLKFAQNVQLTAQDMHDASASIDAIDFMTRVYCYSEIHGIGKYYLARKMRINLCDPTDSEIEIGTEEPSLTDLTLSANSRTDASMSLLSSRVTGLEHPTQST